jgi:hypothetical protein
MQGVAFGLHLVAAWLHAASSGHSSSRSAQQLCWGSLQMLEIRWNWPHQT